ncbi:hypothetical protein WJX84_007859 [Apatococcus fuscideae]|uniref:S-adenosyl-L-methionine-dependent methyltransferase n=1 Tax=Apatococcus fuscideae TaxID=2026836 RepID=A0AAW1TBS4_9CHLO
MCRAYRQLCLPVSQVSAFLRFQTGPNAFTLKAPRRSQPSLWCSQATGTSALDCPLFEQCSGCNIDNALDKPPLSGRAASYVQEVHPQAVFSAEPCRQTHGWRCRAKLAVRGTPDCPTIGLFGAGTHQIVDLPTCRVQHPQLDVAVELVRQAIRQLQICPYDEASGLGDLRYLQLTAAGSKASGWQAQHDDAASIQVVLVWNYEKPSRVQEMPASLVELAAQIWGVQNASSAHAHTGSQQPAASASPGLIHSANFGAMDAALVAIAGSVLPHAAIADLHAGVGTIGLSLAAMGRCSLLRCVEISSAGERAFWRSAARLPVPHIPLEYHVASAGSSPAAWLDGMDVAILDPPRKGLDAQLLAFLCTKAPRPPKLELAQSGRQHQMARSNHDKILRATGPDGERDDMTSTDIAGLVSMPGTDSLETLAVFMRSEQ